MANLSKSQKDPVCGMNVNPEQSNFKTKVGDKQYCFCCQECMDKFKKNPQQFNK